MATIAVHSLASPEALPRILGLFAQRGLVPARLSGQREQDRLLIELEAECESGAALDVLLAKLNALVLVERAWVVTPRACSR